MLRIIKNIVLGGSCLWVAFSGQEVFSVKEEILICPPTQYAFYQQTLLSDGCHLFPRFNFELWKKYKIRKDQGEDLFMDDDFLPTVWALQQTAIPLKSFYTSFSNLLGRNGPFKEYYDDLLRDFVSVGEFTKENGAPYKRVFFLRFTERIMRIKHTPYQSYRLDESSLVTLAQPLYKTSDGKWRRIVDAKARQTEEVQVSGSTSVFTSGNINVEFSATFHELRGKMPRNVGLFELILFMNGIDRENNLIAVGHTQYAAYKELRDEITKTENDLEAPGCHPYSQPLPEVMLESVMAKILSRYPFLKEKFLQTIDFCFTPWKHYQSVYHPAYPGQQAKNFMPCEDLMLAFYVSQSARFLYASAIGNEAFLDVIECPTHRFIRFLQSRLAFKVFPNAAKMCKKAQKQKDILIEGRHQNVSFLDAWEEMVQLIISTGATAFISFDSHGSVRVFEEEDIPQEFSDPVVGRRLRMHVVDSSYGKTISRWYSRMGTEDDFLPGSRRS